MSTLLSQLIFLNIMIQWQGYQHGRNNDHGQYASLHI